MNAAPGHALPGKAPDREETIAALKSALSGLRHGAGAIEILRWESSLYSSTFPAALMVCRFADGTERRLICKYHGGAPLVESYGHRHGVAYEAAVYRDILRQSAVSTPLFYGSHADGETGQAWLFLEYLEGNERLNKTADPRVVASAARWLGAFQADNQKREAEKHLPYLTSYDRSYYEGWAERTWDLAGSSRVRFPWLSAVCSRFEECIRVLLAASPTVIHGEFYPKNVLVSRGEIFPVDWESAAVAAGEIDMASLTEGWPPPLVHECEQAYRQARWPQEENTAYDRTMLAAHIYHQFRWLGDRAEWTDTEGALWRFDVLRVLAERYGLITGGS